MKIKSWYGPCGALVTDKPVEGLTQALEPDSATYYGGPYFIAETIMSESGARMISEALGFEYQGRANG